MLIHIFIHVIVRALIHIFIDAIVRVLSHLFFDAIVRALTPAGVSPRPGDVPAARARRRAL